jgi:hypothetical protein
MGEESCQADIWTLHGVLGGMLLYLRFLVEEDHLDILPSEQVRPCLS